jgi:hypothetical protein
MRRLFVCVALGWSVPLHAADDPKALIEKAVKAMGGAETLAQCSATHTRYTGHVVLGTTNKMNFKGESFDQRAGASRMHFVLDMPDNKTEMILVNNGDKSWQSMNGSVSDATAYNKEYQDQAAYQDRVTRLVSLLRDKEFTLTALGESKVEDRAVLGVKVACKGKPDFSLFFDKETGLLTRYSYRDKQPGLETEAVTEVILRDYRELNLGAADEKALKEAKIDFDGPALVKYVRGLIPDAANIARAKALIKQLGDDSFDVREKATADLIKLGRIAVPLLQQASKDDDREVARRADDCLSRIGNQTGNVAVASAVRLLAIKRPTGAVEALLDYLPSAEAPVAREIKAALVVLARRDGKPDPALTKALDDKDAFRRLVAAAVLGKDGGAYLKEAGRRIYLPGLKTAAKVIYYSNGNKTSEMDVTEVEYFNRFEDKLFARP